MKGLIIGCVIGFFILVGMFLVHGPGYFTFPKVFIQNPPTVYTDCKCMCGEERVEWRDYVDRYNKARANFL